MTEKERKQIEANKYKKYLIGSRFMHFKGNYYKVLNLSIDSETDEIMVIYNSCKDETLVWNRPLTMFLSEVDHVKYPEVNQKYRFEFVDNDLDTVDEYFIICFLYKFRELNK